MTFIHTYYRRYYHQDNELEQVIAPIKNKSESAEKVERTLETIYNSSKALSSLKCQDTASIYDVLEYNGIKLNALYEHADQGNTVDGDRMDVDAEGDENDEATADLLANPNGELHRYIPLGEIQKKNAMLLVGVSNIPSDILEFSALIENVLDNIMRLIFDNTACTKKDDGSEVAVSPGFQWSYMGVKKMNMDKQTVYVAFEDAMMMYLFKLIIESLSNEDEKKIGVIGSKELEDMIIPKLIEIFDINDDKFDTIREEISKHLSEIGQIARKEILKTAPKDDYLTRCKRLSENYRIDPRDLSDVPSDLLDTVKQNIIDFRLHVLTDLERKQKERMLQDKLTVQKEMDQIYHSNNISESAYEHEKQQEKIFGNMSDIEYESMLQSKEKGLLEKQYYRRLNQYKKKEEVRLKNILNFQMFTKHESYLNNVVRKNRKRFLENFVLNVNDAKNKIDMNFNYYTRHSNYAQYREKAKFAEQEKDILDEKGEKISRDDSEGSNSNKVEPEKNDQSSEHTDVEITTTTAQDDLTGKICSVVKKYGTIEVEQLQFIQNFISGNECKDKRSKVFREFKKSVGDLVPSLDSKSLTKVVDELLSIAK